MNLGDPIWGILVEDQGQVTRVDTPAHELLVWTLIGQLLRPGLAGAGRGSSRVQVDIRSRTAEVRTGSSVSGGLNTPLVMIMMMVRHRVLSQDDVTGSLSPQYSSVWAWIDCWAGRAWEQATPAKTHCWGQFCYFLSAVSASLQ